MFLFFLLSRVAFAVTADDVGDANIWQLNMEDVAQWFGVIVTCLVLVSTDVKRKIVFGSAMPYGSFDM